MSRTPSTTLTMLAVTAGLAGLGTLQAKSSCSDRPGTPNNVVMYPTSPTSVEVRWRNTTNRGMNPSGSTSRDPTRAMFFDMYFRNRAQGDIGRDLTGTGPYQVNYGMVSSRTFDNLAPSTTYCFSLRARTRGGKEGCISALQSNWACATTLAAGAPAVAAPPVGGAPGPAAPRISIEGKPDNTLVITGTGFQPQAPLTIRTVNRALQQAYIMTIGGQRITSTASGSVAVTLVGLCKVRGDRLHFTINDGRRDPNDRVTGTLWSNTVTADCT